jgi:plastocyanin
MQRRFMFAALNPLPHFTFGPYTPVAQYLAARNMLAYATLYGGGPSPYFGPGYGLPYPPIAPSALAYGMPYAGGYGTMPAYAAGYAAMATYGTAGNYGSTAQVATSAKPVNALDYLRKHGGGLDWPLGLRVLEPKDTSKDLRQQIDDAVETMFRQPDGTDTTPKLLQQVAKDVAELDRIYKKHVWDMALTRQQEADVKEFLRKVRDALAAAGESAQSYSQSQLVGSRTPRREQTNEVGVYDNHFEPKSIEIAAGTTVHWKSHGTHQHTVTADKDEWLSLDLKPETEVTVTFNKAGTYHYHCNVHPKEMRGTIVVK